MRQKLVETGAVDVMIDVRGNFFHTRTVPCQLWFFDRAKVDEDFDFEEALRSIHIDLAGLNEESYSVALGKLRYRNMCNDRESPPGGSTDDRA